MAIKTTTAKRTYKRGDIVWVNIPDGVGHEENGTHTFLLMHRDPYCKVWMAAPLQRNGAKEDYQKYDTNVTEQPRHINFGHIRSIDETRIINPYRKTDGTYSHLSKKEMSRLLYKCSAFFEEAADETLESSFSDEEGAFEENNLSA